MPEPRSESTLETIDRSVFEWVESLNIHANTNKGFTKTNIFWATPERAFLVKNQQISRDNEGTLIFPIISIERASVTKSLSKKGSVYGNTPPVNDEKGCAIEISRIVNNGKSADFINAETRKNKKGPINFPSREKLNNKVVYQTISIPIPVYLDIVYKIRIKSQYQQQQNEILAPFLVYTGGINYLILKHADHRYEGFVQENVELNNNIGNFENEERIFESIITINVLGHIFGGGVNEQKNKFAVRENFVVVTFPREHIIVGDEPTWITGSFYER